jgi:hypothetical protein
MDQDEPPRQYRLPFMDAVSRPRRLLRVGGLFDEFHEDKASNLASRRGLLCHGQKVKKRPRNVHGQMVKIDTGTGASPPLTQFIILLDSRACQGICRDFVSVWEYVRDRGSP